MDEPTKTPQSARCRGSDPVRSGHSRREFISLLALGCAGLLSADALAGSLPTVREPGGPVRAGQILSEEQMRLLREFVEAIIPETDTPGAAKTDSHGFIDDQLANCRSPDEARYFIAELDKAGALVVQRWNTAFPDLPAELRNEVMTAIARNDEPFDVLPGDFFLKLKSLTLLAYYSSEAGAAEELVYLPIAGGYDGGYTVSDNGGRAFSPPVF